MLRFIISSILTQRDRRAKFHEASNSCAKGFAYYARKVVRQPSRATSVFLPWDFSHVDCQYYQQHKDHHVYKLYA